MHALRDRNQGITGAVEPLPGATGSSEATALAARPNYRKRLFQLPADFAGRLDPGELMEINVALRAVLDLE